MRATHRDYLHPKHIRVEIGQSIKAWSLGQGWYEKAALCLSPSCSDYPRLYKDSLLKWRGEER